MHLRYVRLALILKHFVRLVIRYKHLIGLLKRSIKAVLRSYLPVGDFDVWPAKAVFIMSLFHVHNLLPNVFV